MCEAKDGLHIAENHILVETVDIHTGEVKWNFRFPVTYYETSTSAIVGDYLYVQSSFGKLYKINWKESSGDITESPDVTTFYNVPAIDSDVVIPSTIPEGVDGKNNADGFTSLSYNSGVLFSKGVTGMIYCFDLDLKEPVWACSSFLTDE